MDKEIVVHMCNRILLSCLKEWIWLHEYIILYSWVSRSEVNELGACYTEWSKSEREKQVSYMNAYVWNLEKWCWWTHLHRRNGDTGVENTLMDTSRQGEVKTNWESSIGIYTLLCVK